MIQVVGTWPAPSTGLADAWLEYTPAANEIFYHGLLELPWLDHTWTTTIGNGYVSSSHLPGTVNVTVIHQKQSRCRTVQGWAGQNGATTRVTVRPSMITASRVHCM